VHSECFSLDRTLEQYAWALSLRPAFVWLDGAPSGWSYLACDPVETLQANAEPAALAAAIRSLSDWAASQRVCDQPWPRFIGHLSYDAMWCMAQSPSATKLSASRADPVMWFARYAAVLAVDHAQSVAWIFAEDVNAAAVLRQHLQRPVCPQTCLVEGLNASSAADHKHAIERALWHIREGDIYQINLARTWHALLSGACLPLFLEMMRQSAVPYGAYLDCSGYSLFSRSMERFFEWNRATGELRTSPIKGTVASTDDRAADAIELVNNEKESAEHAMIVDLMRNDLSRIATIGSLAVETLDSIEHYAGLSHRVSTVVCRPRPDVDLAAALEALFPPGSVTGVPKRRAMELIDQLEPVRRKAYTGMIGFIDSHGSVKMSVAIRTAMLEGQNLTYYAGGGIVMGSNVEREVEETELKAQVFLNACAALGATRSPAV